MSSPYLIWPDKRLREIAAPVEHIGPEEIALWDRMLKLMYEMPGVGLAAPQIGVLRRIAVVDCGNDKSAAIRLANPEIIEASEELREHDEASPNLPGVSGKVRRPAVVTVRYMDEAGAQRERRFEGLWSTSVQHQIDHLNGKVFVDRLGPVKRRMVLDRFTKLRRRG